MRAVQNGFKEMRVRNGSPTLCSKAESAESAPRNLVPCCPFRTGVQARSVEDRASNSLGVLG